MFDLRKKKVRDNKEENKAIASEEADKNHQLEQERERNAALHNLKEYWNNHHEDLLTKWENYNRMTVEDVEGDHPKSDTIFCLKKYFYRSVLVLTANSVEHKVVTRMLKECCGKLDTYITKDNFRYQAANFQGIIVVHYLQQDTSALTKKGSYDTLESALERFHPRLVISLGVAFGMNPRKQLIGDVLISDSIVSYSEKLKITDGKVRIPYSCIHKWNDYLESLWGCFKESYWLPDKNEAIRWEFGSMLSGGETISDAKRKLELAISASANQCDVCGGEMEGWGIQGQCDKNDIPWVIIKGICDWGVCKNGWQDDALFPPYNMSELISIVEKTANTSKQGTGETETESKESTTGVKAEQKTTRMVSSIIKADADWSENRIVKNDIIKDALQITAAENAFHVFRYLMEYSSDVLSGIPFIPKKEQRRNQRGEVFGAIRQFLAEAKSFIWRLAKILFILILLIFFGRWIPVWLHHSPKVFFTVMVVILAVVVVRIRYFIFKRQREQIRPGFDEVFQSALAVSEIDFARGTCKIANRMTEDLKNVEISWMNQRWNVFVSGSVHEKLEAKQEISERIYPEAEIHKPTKEYINPDTLRAEYTFQEIVYCHVIRKQKIGGYFVESVYKRNDSEYISLYRDMFREKVT